MTKTLRKRLDNAMLPAAMTVGVLLYVILHYTPFFDEGPYMAAASFLQPVLISLMLFLQFNKVAPSDLKPHRWQLKLVVLQAVLFILFAVLAVVLRPASASISLLCECAMLCFICPTASAAGVITSKLGGDLAGVITYTVFSCLLAAILIPLMIPLVYPSSGVSFIQALLPVARRVFSILVLPCVLAWLIRYTIPPLQAFFARNAGVSFYIWGVSLALSMSLATKALVLSGVAFFVIVLMGVVSLLCCLFQFRTGRRAARSYGRVESVSAGQALGQKNTGFIIWLGLTYMTPVTSLVGGLYAIWHNLVNSYELVHNDA